MAPNFKYLYFLLLLFSNSYYLLAFEEGKSSIITFKSENYLFSKNYNQVYPEKSRGLVAISNKSGGVYLSWRLFNTDPNSTTFDIYRVSNGIDTKLNSEPIKNTTDFIDLSGNITENDWYIIPSNTQTKSNLAIKAENPEETFLQFSTSVGTHGRNIAVGHFKNTEKLDFVLKHTAETIDPYYSKWRPSSTTYKLDAFDQSGNKLWQYDMGIAIETGIWYAPYAVYDLDGDGISEVIVKAGDESLSAEDIKDETGRVVAGPEYLRVLSGEDGNTILAQTDWPSREGFTRGDPEGTPVNERQYEDYNRYCRNFIAIAYLDGKNPYLIVNRGTYGKHKTRAYRYSNKSLELIWSWENINPDDGGDSSLWGQGAHTIQAVDVDGDGKDEVVLGALILDDDGEPLYSIDKGHVDHVYIADILPNNPGSELYFGAEWGKSNGGMGLHDAATGNEIWSVNFPTTHIHAQGLCADLDASRPGMELYSGEHDESIKFTWQSDGTLINNNDLGGLSPLSLHWDADNQEELLVTSGDIHDNIVRHITDYPTQLEVDVLSAPFDTAPDDRQSLRPIAVFDLFGDWRDEIIVSGRGRLLVYTSNIPANSRKAWLMQEHNYRMAIANSSQGYYQTPMPNETKVSEISILDENLTLDLGDVYNLQFEIFPVNAANKSVIWSSANNDIVTVDENGVITAVSEGNTFVEVITIDGEFSDQIEIFVVDNTVIPDEPDENSISIWPNPTEKTLHVDGIINICHVKIISTDGKLINEMKISQKNNTIDISKFSEGIYIFQFIHRGKINYKKVIKTKY